MLQGITTKYVGPTNCRGSRIKAIAAKRTASFPEQSASVPYGYGGTEEEHCRGAKHLAEKLGWAGVWFGGGNAEGNGYHFVSLGRADPVLIDPLTRRGVEGKDWFVVKSSD